MKSNELASALLGDRCLLIVVWLMSSLWAASLHAEICRPDSSSSELAPGVTYYDCSDKNPKVRVVTIDRSLPDREIHILAQPIDQNTFHLRQLDTLARMNNALVAINGFYWSGDLGLECWFLLLPCEKGTPDTTVFLNGERRTTPKIDPETQQPKVEVLMGFAKGGPSGIRAKRIPEENLFDGENEPYRQWLYGSEKTVIKDGQFVGNGGDTDNQSFAGYSDTHLVFLITEDDYKMDEIASTLSAFQVTDAIRNDGGSSTALYLGNGLNRYFDPTGSSRKIAYGVGLVPRPTTTFCSQITDDHFVVIGNLCVTAESRGYDANFITLDDGANRCGSFDFNLVSKDGERVLDQGAFNACTGDSQSYSYFFETGTMGGCATLHLVQASGDDFGNTEWEQSSCGISLPPIPIPGSSDPTPPVSTATATAANPSGWNNTDVLVQISAIDSGLGATGVRAIHLSLSGAQTGSIVIPGAEGSITVSAEGTTYLTYFAIDNVGNAETAKTITLRIDKTPPSISGMPTAACTLWAPNHKMVDVATVDATDNLSGMVMFDVSGSSNEPPNNREPDVAITGSGLQQRTVQLRSERSGRGTGRAYTISASAGDVAGNMAQATALCTVAHDQRP